MRPTLRVFCDVDGTVCPEDVGEQFFRTHAPDAAERIVQDYLRGVIGAREFLRRECAAIGPMTPEVFDAFADRFAVDPRFPAFVRFCEQEGIPIAVVSDGLDRYVHRILANAGLDRIAAVANRVEFATVDGVARIAVGFPNTDAECDRCGTCKRNYLLTRSSDEDVTVYVGDGYSDRCPVRYADIVFARRHLIPFCQEENITYHEFRHFGDVQDRLTQILSRPRIRKRREAQHACRAVFMQE